MEKKLSDVAVKEFLINKFDEFLKSKNKSKVANEIDEYCTKIVQCDGDLKMSNEMRTVVEGCLDLSHWGRKNMLKPNYSEKDIEKILQLLKRGKIK